MLAKRGPTSAELPGCVATSDTETFIIRTSDRAEWVPIFCTDANRRTLFGASSAERKDVHPARDIPCTSERLLSINQESEFFPSLRRCSVSLSRSPLVLRSSYAPLPFRVLQTDGGSKLTRVTGEEDIFAGRDAPYIRGKFNVPSPDGAREARAINQLFGRACTRKGCNWVEPRSVIVNGVVLARRGRF